jgi:hypothetical protein
MPFAVKISAFCIKQKNQCGALLQTFKLHEEKALSSIASLLEE